MYACLFGEYPVSATKDHITMANKVLNHKFQLPSNELQNRTDVKELLCHLLEKNPNQRLCCLDELRQTSFMSSIDFDRIYSKSYSPLTILMNTKSEWYNDLKIHYYHRQKLKIDDNNEPPLCSTTSHVQHQYENLEKPLLSK
jgi:hypothetical protein